MRTDANQVEMKSALEALGCIVAVTSKVGDGFPDFVVGYVLVNELAEVKDPRQPRHDREKNKRQQEFRKRWPNRVWTLMDAQDCIELRDYMKRKWESMR